MLQLSEREARCKKLPRAKENEGIGKQSEYCTSHRGTLDYVLCLSNNSTRDDLILDPRAHMTSHWESFLDCQSIESGVMCTGNNIECKVVGFGPCT